MAMLIRLAIAVVLLGHAAIHLAFLTPRPATASGPRWPFDLERSWLVARSSAPIAMVRALAGALVVALLAAYSVGAVGLVLDAPGLAATSIAIGSALSLAVLGLFPDRWLVLGAVIDVVLLWGVLVGEWSTRSLPD